MNWFQFVRLIHSIYRHGGPLPDLEWIQRLGLLAVKLGQVHALRVDFLDREKCEHLARLYRQNSTIPAQDFRALLRSSAGDGFFDHFKEISETPLASASVGQVHRAQLLDGSLVVVKAIKHEVREQFIRDVDGTRRLLRFCTALYPKLRKVGDPLGILNDIEEYTLSELDLRHEVTGQKTLRSIYEDNRGRFDLSKLQFAYVHESLCNDRIMVSEWIPGPSFDELLEKGNLPYPQLLELFRIHGFYMFCIGTFHGDMHPGNVLLSNGQLCFIDTGYIGSVGPKIRRGLFHFFSALSEYYYPRGALAMNSMSEYVLYGPAFDSFRKLFIELYADFEGSTVAQISLTKMMMRTIKLGVHCGMRFEKGIFAIIRSLMYLDGMVLRGNPDAVLLRDMRPFIGEFEKLV